MKVIWWGSGKSLTLGCGLEEHDPDQGLQYSLEWRKDGKLIYSVFGHQPGHAAPELQGRLARAPSLGLTVEGVTVADEGVYQCVLTPFHSRAPTSPRFGPQTRVVVNAPPRITRPEDGLVQYHMPSSALHLDCMADGSPPPDISWVKDGAVVSSNGTLSIRSVAEGDGGEYICQALNTEGMAQRTVIVRMAKPTSIHFGPQNRTVNEGSNVFWTCQATGYPDKITYSWKYNGKPIKTTDVGLRSSVMENELSLSPVRPSDAGQYTCEAENGYGSAATANAYLHVNYRPTIPDTAKRLYTAPRGQRVELRCPAIASPAVDRIVWTKNGVPLTGIDAAVLSLANALEGDAGVYGCVAENMVGRSDQFEMHLVIAESPRFSARPPPLIYSKVGGAIEVECLGFGDPMPVQYWLRDKRRISGSKLTIPSVSRADHGSYSCVLTNPVATVKAELKIYVQNTIPQPASISSIECLGEDGLVVEWNPGYDAGLPQSFTLHYENVEMTDERGTVRSKDTQAQIAGLSRFARYRLAVESTNAEGSINSTIREKNVCSRLVAPPTVAVVNGMMSWERTDGAQLYRIEQRDRDGHDANGFIELAEVIGPPYLLPSTSTYRNAEIRVRSLRTNYSQSPPSASIFHQNGTTPSPSASLLWMGIGSGVFLFLFLFLYFVARRNGYFCQYSGKKRRSSIRKSTGISGYDPAHAPGNSFIGGSVKILEDGLDSGHWSGSRNDAINGFVREPYSYDELEIECSSAVEEMFREQYVYGRAVHLEENPRALILEDLRIERLKKECRAAAQEI